MPGMAPDAFEVIRHTGSDPDVHILIVRGAITYASSPEFYEAIASAPAPRLLIDLSSVPAIDSMAVGALVRAFVSCHRAGRKLALVGLNHRVKNVLQITGVDPLFDTYHTTAEAEAALK
jgi:anti-sigma B factor antagonist